MNETGEEGVAREVLEETGLKVEKRPICLRYRTFTFIRIPGSHIGHVLPLQSKDTSHIAAMDDAADAFFVPLMEIHPEDFGLDSIRKGLDMFIHSNSPSYS